MGAPCAGEAPPSPRLLPTRRSPWRKSRVRGGNGRARRAPWRNRRVRGGNRPPSPDCCRPDESRGSRGENGGWGRAGGAMRGFGIEAAVPEEPRGGIGGFGAEMGAPQPRLLPARRVPRIAWRERRVRGGPAAPCEGPGRKWPRPAAGEAPPTLPGRRRPLPCARFSAPNPLFLPREVAPWRE